MERRRHVYELTADFEFATQAFIDGAEAVTELRSASFMGVLRFWWRALAWRAIPEHSDANARLATLRAWEDALFGATRTGSGAFTMMIEPTVEGQKPPTIEEADIRSAPRGKAFHTNEDASLAYVTGVWVDRKRARSIRQGSAFRVRFLSRRNPRQGPAPSAPSLVDAVRILGLIGGLGARSRRGFGSLVLTGLGLRGGDGDVETIAVARTFGEYCAELAALLQASGDAMPPFTAFGPGIRILLQTKTCGTAASAQAAALLDMRASRSYLNMASVGGIARSSDTIDGHDWFKQARSPGWRSKVLGSSPSSPPLGPLPKKTAFGLPLGFFSTENSGDQFKTTVLPAGDGSDRRASPLFLHVHRIGGGYVAAWVFIPAQFLKDRADVGVRHRVKKSGGTWTDVPEWFDSSGVDFGSVERFIVTLSASGRYRDITTTASAGQGENEGGRS